MKFLKQFIAVLHFQVMIERIGDDGVSAVADIEIRTACDLQSSSCLMKIRMSGKTESDDLVFGWILSRAVENLIGVGSFNPASSDDIGFGGFTDAGQGEEVIREGHVFINHSVIAQNIG